MLVQINQSNQKQPKAFALFNLGFRPFFLGACVFSIISIGMWAYMYLSSSFTAIENITASQWHAHEMLYGYGIAVLAGFLLTAVRNWTGRPTVFGTPLILLFLLWCLARVLFLFGTKFLAWATAIDLLFNFMLLLAVSIPIIKARSWKQLAVASKVLLLVVGNVLFMLGYFGLVINGVFLAINGAVLLFISLILMIGRRVIPFFIERGLEVRTPLKQFKWVDIGILLAFLVLFINVLFLQMSNITILLALVLFGLNGYRLCNWHVSGLWRAPLLWSLYLSAWLINIGFLFYALEATVSMSIFTLHIFTIGGIGLITLAMMSRVALGHTGRDIKKPSTWLNVAFISMILSVLFRVIVPMAFPSLYVYWVLLSAIFWILSFVIFIVTYLPILVKPRVDGSFG